MWDCLFSTFSLLPSHTYLLFVMDVSSLYTSIPLADGRIALKHYLDQRTNSDIPTSVILCLMKLVLTLNSFEFDEEHYPQTSGICDGNESWSSFRMSLHGFSGKAQSTGLPWPNPVDVHEIH
jgi:hypothetical protein